MDIYRNTKEGIKVRTVEVRDIPNILQIVRREDFGYVGLDEDCGVNIYDTQRLLDMIVNKEIISSEGLVIEEHGSFRGYAIIDRPSENTYYVSQIAVSSEHRRKGYGTLLMNVIKKLANQDLSTIRLTCKSYSGSRLFDRIGIHSDGGYSPSRYSFDTETPIQKELPRIFPYYSMIREEKEKRIEESVKSFSKFLKSDLGRRINNI